MPVNFLSEDQKAGYGNYHGELTKETLARYFHLDDFDRMNISEKRGDHNRLGYAILLCTVRYLGRFPDLTTIIPVAVIDFLAEQLHIESGSEQVNIYNSGKQRRQHIDEITKIYGYTEFTDTRVAFSLTRWLYSLCWTGTSRPGILFERCTGWLLSHKVLLPGYSLLERYIARLRNRVENRLWYSLAANRLHLSRSAIGKTIARLEQRLGVRLFHRTTRSLNLTDDGALFYERCLRALEEIRVAENLLESGKRQVSGRLRVSMPVLIGRLCIAPVLTALAREHPGLELDLSFSDRVVDVAEEGFDLAVRNGPLPDSAGLVARRLGDNRMTLCASPDYLARCGAPDSIEELPQHDAIAYRYAAMIRSWLIPQADGTMREVMPKPRLLMDDLQAIADAAVAGFGIAWLPCWLIRDALLEGRLQQVLGEVPGKDFEVHAVWPLTPHLPLKVRLAVDALVSHLPARMAL